MAGLFFKMALVPFHMWTPDVYEGSPTMITAYMSTAVKATSFAVFVKVFAVAFGPALYESGNQAFSQVKNLISLEVSWQPLLAWISLLTMFFGNLIAVYQNNIKRMLAYSSIAHAGYMSLGILAANPEGRMGVLFYLLSYTITGIGAFGAVYIVDGKEREAQTLDDYRGMGFKYPFLAFLMTFFLVTMIGLPPTSGFLSKFFVFSAAIKSGYTLLAAMGILTSVIAAYYYLRVVYMLYMKEPVRETAPGRVGAPAWLALVFSAIGIIYLGIFPEGLVKLAFEAQKSLAFVF
jgi:NADH-quinone oxidoreductase subunit N